jgi:hypothetical protein
LFDFEEISFFLLGKEYFQKSNHPTMDMYSKNQYLKELRREYLKTKSKREKGRLLDEAEKRTGLNRKYLMEKLRPKSNLDKRKDERKKRKIIYDGYVKDALVKVWRILDYPCGQRLAPLLKNTDIIERLRTFKELNCSDEVVLKLKKISFRTIDEKLKHQKEIERIRKKYQKKVHPLLYQKIPIKLSDAWDRKQLGNIQTDLIEHCGQSARGEYINTVSNTDIATGWWEGQAIMGRGQIPTCQGLAQARKRFPFEWREIHSDNGREYINAHLFRYTQKEELDFSRSRPNKKNDNCFVEQKNWTHVKKFVGYLRYDTFKEQEILNDLYGNELRLYKNFFQPVIKLISKERIGGKIHRKYDTAKTPYQRVMESKEVPKARKQELEKTYNSLNPAQLKRTIDKKLSLLYQAYQEKNHCQKVELKKKLKPFSVRNYIAQPEPISVR